MVFTVLENTALTADVYDLRLRGDCAGITAPGQFVNLLLPGHFLRRPISVAQWTKDSLRLVYRAVGEGTRDLSRMEAGARIDLLTGLGNGFDVKKAAGTPLVLGGGVGAPPLLALTEALLKEGKEPVVALGFNGAQDAILVKDFELLLLGTPGARLILATLDGTLGEKGFVTDAARGAGESCGCVFACGPEPMLRAAYASFDLPGQFSFEARMACGFGACMGCSCKTKFGSKRVCADGPVFFREEILWRTRG